MAEAEKMALDWAANYARRDQMVRTVKASGLSKLRIHELTGIARTTIDRILKESTVTETSTYTRTTEEGTETTKVIRDGEEVREIYTIDGDVCDDSIVCDSDADEYLRRRDMELRGEGYTPTAV